MFKRFEWMAEEYGTEKKIIATEKKQHEQWHRLTRPDLAICECAQSRRFCQTHYCNDPTYHCTARKSTQAQEDGVLCGVQQLIEDYAARRS